MHNSRDKFWKRMIFKAKQREWDETLYGKAVIHQSVTLRTASIDNREDGGYEPWILEHEPDIEPWTELSGRTDPPDDTKKDFDALEGWCAPKRPSGAVEPDQVRAGSQKSGEPCSSPPDRNARPPNFGFRESAPCASRIIRHGQERQGGTS